MHPFNTSRKFLAIAEGAEEQREEQLRQARDEIIAEIWAQVRTTLSSTLPADELTTVCVRPLRTANSVAWSRCSGEPDSLVPSLFLSGL